MEKEVLMKKREKLLSIYTEEELNRATIWLDSMIERGKKNIYQERYEEWENIVYNNLFSGSFVTALESIELLENGISFEEVIDKLKKKNHSSHSLSSITNIILKYSKKGPEFYLKLYGALITPKVMYIICTIKEENLKFEYQEFRRTVEQLQQNNNKNNIK